MPNCEDGHDETPNADEGNEAMISNQPRDLRIGSCVRMSGSGDPELDGRNGSILGLPSPYNGFLYVVHLDIPRASGERAVSLDGAKLDRLPR
jgi:hypothetical protein